MKMPKANSSNRWVHIPQTKYFAILGQKYFVPDCASIRLGNYLCNGSVKKLGLEVFIKLSNPLQHFPILNKLYALKHIQM